MTQAALELVDIHKSFGKTQIINGVDLAVQDGERHAVIGPNGAGKSTLFNLISGFYEVSSGQTFFLEAYEYTSAAGKAEFILYARDGWHLVDLWQASGQLRWNKTSDERAVKDILALILGRAGLRLGVKTQSAVLTGFCPDFALHAGGSGLAAVRKLLSFVPDLLFVEGNTVYTVNPNPATA